MAEDSARQESGLGGVAIWIVAFAVAFLVVRGWSDDEKRGAATLSTADRQSSRHRADREPTRVAAPTTYATQPDPILVQPEPKPVPVLDASRSVKLRSRNAKACGVKVLSPAPFEHGRADEGVSTIDTYSAKDWWGSIVVMCFRFPSGASPTELSGILATMTDNVRRAEGWQVVGERRVMMGGHPATEVDVHAVQGGPEPFARWRLAVVGEVIHAQSLTLVGTPASGSKLDTLLNGARLSKKASRGSRRRYQSVAPWPSSPSLPPTNTRGDVWVRPYTRSDGTQVRGHYRSRPSR